MQKYRNEFKFLCSQGELEIIRSRLNVLMQQDEHQDGDCYRIRSVYFDDYQDSAFDENEAGVDNRRKIRLRVYDQPKSRINLEIKYKQRGRTYKSSCLVSAELCDELISGQTPINQSQYPKQLRQLLLEMNQYRMKPRIIVEYERTAFVCHLGNVRITFDRNVSYSKDISAFFDDRISLIPILPTGQHILEVKYDEFIPDYIAQAVELGNLSYTSYSKYYMARLSEKGEIF